MRALLQLWTLPTLYINIVLVWADKAKTTHFVANSTCLNQTCSGKLERRARSKIHCVSACASDDTCAGIQYGDQGHCTLYKSECFQDWAQSCTDPTLQVFERKTDVLNCQNNGTWDAQTQRCLCRSGWIGLGCDRRPTSCEDLRQSGYKEGIHWVNLDLYQNQSSVQVRCNLLSDQTRTYIFSSDGTMSHNRSWHDYVNGYKLNESNFWLGLEHMLALNRDHTDVLFGFAVIPNSGPEIEIWHNTVYSNFSLQNASSNYMFTSSFGRHCSGLPNDLSDVLGPCANRPFLTPDVDQTLGCAEMAGTGWWFPDCSAGLTINPLGMLADTGDQSLRIPGLDINHMILSNLGIVIRMAFYTYN